MSAETKNNESVVPGHFDRWITLPKLCAVALMALGAAVLWGWAFDIPAFKSVLPGFASLKANGALCFLLSGIALARLEDGETPHRRRIVLICAGGILVVTGLTLVQQVTGLELGVDQLLFSDPDTPSTLHPGRMATATSAGLLLAGLAFVAGLHAERSRLADLLAKGLSSAVLGIGAIALLGYAISFNFLYTWYAFGSIAVHTALGLVILGAGLLAADRRALPVSDDARIARLATVLLAAVAGITGISVATLIEREVERALDEGLRIGLHSLTAQTESGVELRAARAAIIATRPDLLYYTRQLALDPDDTGSRTALAEVLASFVPHGFSGLAVHGPDGSELARAGSFTANPALAVPLDHPEGTALLWRDGFYLHHHLVLRDASGPLGLVMAEQPLPHLTHDVLDSAAFGNTVEFLLCRGQAGGSFLCFPTRLNPRPFSIEPLHGGSQCFVQRAATEGLGFGSTLDYRGRRVLGAYGPVGDLGLVAVLKIDARELYAGIGAKFLMVMLLTASLIAGGSWLVGIRVRPLATALETRVRERTAEIAAANGRLRESEERFLQVADMSSQWIWEQDAEGRYTYSSGAVRELLGYEPEDVLGRCYLDFLVEDLREQRRAGMNVDRAQPLGFSRLINRYRHRDGHEVYTESTGAPLLDEAGRVAKWRGVDYDIGWQRAKQAAEAANRAKSEFLANMSHEIRTPINGIIGMTELALDTDLAPEQREYLTLARESADSLLRLINDILDFSKIEAGRLDLEAVDFNLRDGLEGILKTLALRAHKQGLELACHVPPDVPDRLVGDPGRLYQIVVNLVGNAIKFTEKGEVVVDVAVESRSGMEARLHFSVRDTGIGIPPEKQRSIFAAFSQADASTTRKYGGTGLGLAIASRLVELMGGRIWLESEAGRGSLFHFSLPFGLQSGSPAPALPRELADARGLPVLVVDDNATNRRILEEMLSNWGMKPRVVDSGRAALLEMRRIADSGAALPLVLLDAMMPGMDGFELAEQIKQHPEFARASIMMLSSAAQPGEAARCRRLGMAAYLIKPVKQSDLLEAILATLHRPETATRPAPPPRTEPLATGPGLKVLLAEDNPVNQRLAVRMLEKRGHRVVVAATGREALAALDRETFDLALMDVQMPEMDGFEATAALRERERTTGTHLPVIAMTAHAMKGDRERCLAAGMDDYLAKPIRAERLFEVVEGIAQPPPQPSNRKRDAGEPPPRPSNRKRLVREHRTNPSPVVTEEGVLVPSPAERGRVREGVLSPIEPIFDRNLALARAGGDETLLREIAGLFLEQTPGLLRDIEAAIARRDAETLRRKAHTLKGSIGNFGAPAAFEAALRLEMIGRDNRLDEAGAAHAELAAAVARLETALAALTAIGPAGAAA